MSDESQSEAIDIVEDGLKALDADREAMKQDAQHTALLTRRVLIAIEQMNPVPSLTCFARKGSSTKSQLINRQQQKVGEVRRMRKTARHRYA
jgi:hypothetical protein